MFSVSDTGGLHLPGIFFGEPIDIVSPAAFALIKKWAIILIFPEDFAPLQRMNKGELLIIETTAKVFGV